MSLSRRVVPLTALVTAPLLAVLASAPAGAAARGEHRTPVVVRVYELGAARSPDLIETLAESAARLLERVNTNVAIEFVDCAKPAACSAVAPGAFVMRLSPGVHATAPRQCGEASKGAGQQRGVLMTIFRGCVAETRRELRDGAIAEQGISFSLLSLSESDILAAVVVHELIHLVLPDEVHGKGLFKATLDPRDWLDLASGWPQLESALVSRMDRALAGESLPRTVLAERRADAAPAAPQPQP